jgi:spermidine synthase
LTLVVAGVGLAQMLLELVLLFAYQALHGSLYGEVSLLVTAFMAGLALGGAAGSRVGVLTHSGSTSQAAAPGPGQSQSNAAMKSGSSRSLRRVLITVLAGMALYGAVLPMLFSIGSDSGGVPRLAFLALALLGGVLGGMVFPLAAALRITDERSQPAGQSTIRKPQAAIAGLLYSADLAGGCLGALFGAVLLIPILGIPQTCAVISFLAVAGLLAML